MAAVVSLIAAKVDSGVQGLFLERFLLRFVCTQILKALCVEGGRGKARRRGTHERWKKNRKNQHRNR